MAFLLNQYLPPPQSADQFIHLCADLYARVFNDPNIHRHSFHGSPRHDVDLWGYEDGAGELFGIHCAFCGLDGSMAPDKPSLRKTIEATWEFRPSINHLVIVTNIANEDVVQEVRRHARALTAKRPYFRCDVVGWLEAQRLIGTHASLVEKYYPSAIYDFEDLDVTSDADAANPYREAVLPALSNALYKMRNKNRRETDDPFLDLPNLIHDTCPGCGTSVAEWVVVCPGCGAHIVRGATPEELASFGTVVFFLALMFFVAMGRYLVTWVPIIPGWATALVLSAGCGVAAFFFASWLSRCSRRVRGAEYHTPLQRVRCDTPSETEGDPPFPPSPF